MADGNPILEQVKKDVASGYSKESIIAELKRIGKYDDELKAFLEGSEPEVETPETEEVKKKDEFTLSGLGDGELVSSQFSPPSLKSVSDATSLDLGITPEQFEKHEAERQKVIDEEYGGDETAYNRAHEDTEIRRLAEETLVGEINALEMDVQRHIDVWNTHKDDPEAMREAFIALRQGELDKAREEDQGDLSYQKLESGIRHEAEMMASFATEDDLRKFIMSNHADKLNSVVRLNNESFLTKEKMNNWLKYGEADPSKYEGGDVSDIFPEMLSREEYEKQDRASQQVITGDFIPYSPVTRGVMSQFDIDGVDPSAFNPDEVGVNAVNLMNAAYTAQHAVERRQKLVEERAEDLEDNYGIQNIAHDFNTGLMGVGSAFQSFWDRAGASQQQYEMMLRDEARYASLSEEERSKTITELLSEGNLSAASTKFGVEMVSTVPQLLTQVGVMMATNLVGRGMFGKGVSQQFARWLGAGTIGAQSFGSTWASTYGQMPDDRAFMLAFGDGMSEALATRLVGGAEDALAFKGTFGGMTRQEIRRNFLKKGILSPEMKKMMRQFGTSTLKTSKEEMFEEMLAQVGSGVVHSIVNDEEINIFEILDAGLLGFAMGGGAKMTSADARKLLTGGVSSMGYGGTFGELITYSKSGQALADRLASESNTIKRNSLESMMMSIHNTIGSIQSDMRAVYDKYTDADAMATVKLNQKLNHTLIKIAKEEDTNVKNTLKKEAVTLYKEIKGIESKYSTQLEDAKQQRTKLTSWISDVTVQGSIEVDDNFDTKDISLLGGIKNMAKSLKATGAKVFVHKSAADAAETAGVEVNEIVGSNGFYIQEDGTVHITAPLAANNTALHEGTHRLARFIDKSFIKRFVDASLKGMDDATRAKYLEIIQSHKDSPRLAYEEVFAEMVADIGVGDISIENQGTSIARSAMNVARDILRNKLGLRIREIATFKEFTGYVTGIAEDMKKGTEARQAPSSARTVHTVLEGVDSMQQAHDKRSSKIQRILSKKSPIEHFGALDPTNSEVFANMTMDDSGNFVFLHISDAEFDKLDPSKIGANTRYTGADEAAEIGMANVGGVSMLYTREVDQDVTGDNHYHVILPPSKVYDGVTDPDGLMAKAKAEMKEKLGIDGTQNTVYAYMTKLANDAGYDVMITPWREGRYKAQTTKNLEVVPKERVYESNSDTWESIVAIDGLAVVDAAVNQLAEALPFGVVKDKVKEMLWRKFGDAYAPFETPKEMAEYVRSHESMKDHQDAVNAFEAAIENIESQRGQSTRKSDKVDEVIKSVEAKFKAKSEGFSFDPVTGEEVAFGTAVGDGTNETVTTSNSRPTSAQIKSTILNALKNPLGVVGGWTDPKTGLFYLDVSEVYNTDATAVRLGEDRNEESVYNIHEDKLIPIKKKILHQKNKKLDVGREGMAVTLNPEGASEPTLKRTAYPFPITDITQEIPMVSMQKFIDGVDGNVQLVTSDATKVGYDSDGEFIDGGFEYLTFTQNIIDKIGFASIDMGTARQTVAAIMNQFPAGAKVGIIIMVQDSSATIGNHFGAKYIHRGLIKLQELGGYDSAYNSILDVLQLASIKKALKALNPEQRADLEQILKDPSSLTDKEFAERFIKDTNFDFRREFGKAILISKNTTRVTKSTKPIKSMLRVGGFTMENFLMEYGATRLLGVNNVINDVGGFAVGGFEFVVPTKEELDASMEKAATSGIKHSLFNGKLNSNGKHFLFDGIYPVQENFVEFAKAETEIKKELHEERDSRVTEYVKEKGMHVVKPEFQNQPAEDITYTHLKDNFKINFKKLNEDLLSPKVPNIKSNVARGIPVSLGKIPAGQTYVRGTLHQATLFREIAQRLLNGATKVEIIQELRDRGISKIEAELIYQKAYGYKQGVNKGRIEGRKARSAEYAQKRRQERAKESAKVKDLRKKMRAIYEQEKKVNDVVIRELVRLARELGGATIKANQLERIIRVVNSVNRLKGRKATSPEMRYEAFNSVVDKVAKVIDGAITAKELADYSEQLKRVNREQKNLMKRLKGLKPSSKSPMVSYSEAISDLTSIDPTLLTNESLNILEDAIQDLKNTTKTVSVRKGEIAAPYIHIEALGEAIDTRRAKIYFAEIFEALHTESMEAKERQVVATAVERAFENGTDWVAEYDKLIQENLKKGLKGAEKRMQEIADEMGLDIEDVQDLEAVLAMMKDEDKEKFEANRDITIEQAIMPTFFNFKNDFLREESFAAIFGVSEDMSPEAMEVVISGRLNRLTGLELKQLEFAMFDYAVNGKAYGIIHLASTIKAKNDGNNKLRKLNMRSETKSKKVSNYIHSRFENTPTFFRRVFKKYSTIKVAKYLDAIGFAALRRNVAIADSVSNKFGEDVVAKAKELKVNTLKAQVHMQILSSLEQKPEGVTEAMWLRGVKSNLELALAADGRFSDSQRAEIAEAMKIMSTPNGQTRAYSVVVSDLRAQEGISEMVDYLRTEFNKQEDGLRNYAEGFLGQQFKPVENYLPLRFRSQGSGVQDVQDLVDGAASLSQVFRSYNKAQAQRQASSTYERNDNAFGSSTRYIDLNFLGSITRAYRENEVKSRAAADVAYISSITSEKNKDFVNSVQDPHFRAEIRKKVFNYLTDGGIVNSKSDEMIGSRLSKALNRVRDITILYYFGSIYRQVLKQGSAILNAMVEGHMNPMELMLTSLQVATGKLPKGMQALAEQYDIGHRDVVEEVISVTSQADAITRGGGFFKKNMDRSTAALRITDKAAALASWYSYYESYRRKEDGHQGSMDWDAEAENPSDMAATYASQMVTKDQNMNVSRDKSEFNSLSQNQAAAILQMIIMPFANFLLNKKLNMALDYQKAFSHDAANRKEGVLSLAGTLGEVTAFHAASQFAIMPLAQAIANGLWGDEEEEESLFDKEFKLRNFAKGMFTDMNPLVMPVGLMESWYAKACNLMVFTATKEDYSLNDKTFWDEFDAWSKVNGLPIYKKYAGREDLGALSFASQFGVFGDVATELGTSMVNLATLSEKNPYMTTARGSTKYFTPEDAKAMRQMEGLKVMVMLVGSITGLFAKESVDVIKAEQRKSMPRGISNERYAIGRLLGDEKYQELGNELILEEIDENKVDNQLGVEGLIRSTVNKGTVAADIDRVTDDKYVNTIRQIEKMSYDDIRYAAMYAQHIMRDMSHEEAEHFKSELYKFFVGKQGGGAVERIAKILEDKNQEDE